MTVPLLMLFLSDVAAFMGRMLTYCAQTEAYGVPWLEYWAYGAYAFAVLFALAFFVELCKSIAHSRRKSRRKNETTRTLPKRLHKQKRR